MTGPGVNQSLQQRILVVLAATANVSGVYLVGSHATGDADDFSDLDLLVVVPEEAHQEFIENWSETRQRITPVVHQAQIGSGESVTFHHITPGWERFDVTICPPRVAAARPANLVAQILDRTGIAFAPPTPPQAPDRAAIEALVIEFWRVVGLLTVVAGRDDRVVMASGSALLRQLVIDVMMQDVAVVNRGGVLHTERLLPSERTRELRAPPAIEASFESAVAVHVACARLFLPLARSLAEQTGASWPHELERATRAHLERELDLELPD